ncbi:tRNA (adenosine(37)-N6)-dimethylallyltransferase MiaA [Ruixingdingia sedimenti]|uniref:tRNA dimethylallyltransferase n=1 Tax=Ruixingdingia sedimenti TaxID=3073604 RepID=A0ABU1F7W0_9RHOB|nr:tRNA (adenosine(37)-N6)-dimethylallyltransferase MiaA [Xinfangfangia sp. LG-4]MDR5652960.1 tRNA (adenosine(37)-N6)-dimethylallyltransferase MiaA [Xinfangfangia sp. LG-4]
MQDWLERVPADRPVLIAGPTASGKSALALALARRQARTVVNADALQVHAAWRVLSARPTEAEEAEAPHLLYGHVPIGADWSVGHWLRAVAAILARDPRPVIVGGTGLYFTALTEGLAEIPPTPPEVRAEGDAIRLRAGAGALLAALDPQTRARIDVQNPARIQRAWEVLQATGRGLAAWQAETGPPVLPLAAAHALVLRPDPAWLGARIDARLDRMVAGGALAEVAAALPRWQEGAPWTRAIGAAEFAAHLRGENTLAEALEAARIATRQYAKRQRTWMRNRLGHWPVLDLP